MIKAIVTDVDGVIVGDKSGFNFPIPNEKVLQAFKQIRSNGIPIVLCTGKGLFPPNLTIIKETNLDNPHITDGGALISDPIDSRTIAKHVIIKTVVEDIIKYSIKNDIYIEIYYDNAYAIQKSQESETTKIHTDIVQLEPEIVDNLLNFAQQKDIIKILCFTKNKEDMPILHPMFEKLGDSISHVWSIHPALLPYQISIITKSGISKKHAVEEVINGLGISFDEVLGIGDTPGDWKFMQLCKYAGVVIGEESKELEKFVREKGEGNYFIAKSVDENGILDIFKYFNLYKQ